MEATVKNQLNILNQLQELVLMRDEHHQTGDGSHTESLARSIDALVNQLEPAPKMFYQRLYKKDHLVMSPMVDNCCGACGMRLPVSQAQQVRLARQLQMCSSCGRILYNEEGDAPRVIAAKPAPARGEARQTGVSRFSAEELMVCDLKSVTTVGAITELVRVMADNKFVSNADALIAAAMERENVLSTALGDGLAFPHVRGVEGGGLTLALGISRDGIEYDADGSKVHIVFFSAIPVAVSAFYLRLIAGLSEAFSKKANRDLLMAATNSAELWKAFVKATKQTVR